MANTFKKTERLKSKKIIESLFKSGQSFSKFPIRIVYTAFPKDFNTEFPAQFTLSVPKRSFPKAVDRNRIRRQVREAYRLNKHFLYDELNNYEQRFAIMFIYQARQELPYSQIENGVRKVLQRFVKGLNKND